MRVISIPFKANVTRGRAGERRTVWVSNKTECIRRERPPLVAVKRSSSPGILRSGPWLPPPRHHDPSRSAERQMTGGAHSGTHRSLLHQHFYKNISLFTDLARRSLVKAFLRWAVICSANQKCRRRSSLCTRNSMGSVEWQVSESSVAFQENGVESHRVVLTSFIAGLYRQGARRYRRRHCHELLRRRRRQRRRSLQRLQRPPLKPLHASPAAAMSYRHHRRRHVPRPSRAVAATLSSVRCVTAARLQHSLLEVGPHPFPHI